MRHRLLMVCLVAGAALALVPAAAFAQEGQIAGTVRDTSGAVIPGVTVEASSPALIEKVRSAVTDTNGQYRLTNLPIGTYKVTFTLAGFTKQERDAVELSSGFTAPVNATMTVGQVSETVLVAATSPVVDVQNARQAITFQGDALKELPTSRNVNALLTLTPGIGSNYRTGQSFGQPGVCVGGIGVFCNPSVNGFNQGDTGSAFDSGLGDPNGANNLNQGRIMVDGQVVNGGTVVGLGGMTTGYTADIASAQEVNIQLSGALGESETGGASINIVPRTGGNKFLGTWNTTYTNDNMFSQNTDAFRKGCNDNPPGICVPAVFQAVKFDYDVSGAYGGPIKRDRAWFYVQGRDQQIRKLPVGVDFWPNLNEGKWGYNYQPDRSKDRVEYQNKWKSYSGRFTYQATQKNKFNVYWDEQDFCQDPCDGVVSVYTSPESWWSVGIKPNRLQQVSWTNPFTNRILLEAGISVTSQFYDTTHHRQYTDPVAIPRVDEFGDTAGADGTAPRVNQFAGGTAFLLTSGSLVSGIASGGAETRDMKNYRSRASMSYVTGSHHAKFGYDGGYYMQDQRNMMNDTRLFYHYRWPASNCSTTADLSTFPCGNTSLQFPSDPFNLGLHPVPANVQFYTGAATVGDRVWYGAAYVQDQWTFRRFTLSGALRYDHAASNYKSTCIGGSNEPYMPVQTSGSKSYCTPDTDGVSFDDITPRWGATYDLFGNGKTSIKLNMGRYNNQAAITGIYSGANPARRTVNTLQRAWNDIDGDRIVDCDLMNFANNGECGAFNSTGAPFGTNLADTARYGKDPSSLDAVGNPVGLGTVQCGRTENGIFTQVKDYCAKYGDSLVSGWGKRQYEWQFGIGIQHEILPRLSGEVTYNKRLYRNLQTTDQLGLGCDRFNGSVDHDTCVQNMMNYVNPTYDFYTVKAPSDPRLPGGGGYTITGLNDQRVAIPGTCLSGGVPTVCNAVTIDPTLNYSWQGVDTNFVWRGPQGLRVNGGTSTGRTSRDRCSSMVDAPSVRGRDGHPYEAGCLTPTIWQTRINGTAAYNIPWIDVLVSTVFQSLPGPSIGASFTYNKSDLVWNAASAGRATEPCSTAAQGVGCLGTARNLTTVSVPLLLNNEVFGERTSLVDLKIAKVLRFSGRRATVGFDIYNLLNSDAINSYNTTYSGTFVNGVFQPAVDNPATPTVNEGNHWGEPTGLVSARFVRLSLQFDF